MTPESPRNKIGPAPAMRQRKFGDALVYSLADAAGDPVPGTSVAPETRTLVVVVHGLRSGPEHMSGIAGVALAARPDAEVLAPRYNKGLGSSEDPNHIAASLMDQVESFLAASATPGADYAKIVLVGHSMGALLVREMFLLGCQKFASAPPPVGAAAPRHALPWPRRVERIILLAGFSRGWTVRNQMGFGLLLGTFVARMWSLLPRSTLLLMQIHRGAPFITQLRAKWVEWRNRYSAEGRAFPLTAQLLGSIDDHVGPEDHVDPVAGSDFLYFDVPESNHLSIRDMSPAGASPGDIRQRRGRIFSRVLTATPAELAAESVQPMDEASMQPQPGVTNVVFVVHGIRDLGYWTSKVARRIVYGSANRRQENWRMVTSSYGYFPMLSFLAPLRRREKMEWLMDQYVEARARYPNAKFHYVGHSNGTWLLAEALERYRFCRFENVVFAGSVVRSTYPWDTIINKEQRVTRVLNLVATADWVVSYIPRFFQRLFPFLGLGGAGHTGFKPAQPGLLEIRCVKGGHGAGVSEPYWDSIANFVRTGEWVDPENPPKVTRQVWWVRGWVAVLAWTLAVVLLSASYCLAWHLPATEFGRGLGVSAYALAIVWILRNA